MSPCQPLHLTNYGVHAEKSQLCSQNGMLMKALTFTMWGGAFAALANTGKPCALAEALECPYQSPQISLIPTYNSCPTMPEVESASTLLLRVVDDDLLVERARDSNMQCCRTQVRLSSRRDMRDRHARRRRRQQEYLEKSVEGLKRKLQADGESHRADSARFRQARGPVHLLH